MIKSKVFPIVLVFFLCPAVGNGIAVYDSFASFAGQCHAIEVFPQDPSNSGTAFEQVTVDGVTINFEGFAFYWNLSGVDYFSKSVPVTLIPDDPAGTQCLGFYIAQVLPVDITVAVEDGNVVILPSYSNHSDDPSGPIEWDTSTFLGFVSSAGISSVQITTPGGYQYITNLGPLAMGTTLSSPQGVLEELMETVEALVPDDLSQDQADGLNDKLSAAIHSLDTERDMVACRQLNAFLNQVNGLVGAGQLDPSIGQALVDEVVALQAALGCG